ncbi:MAG: cytochrome c-type biogenesis protein [Gemmatimonadaceae bacterium]
MTRRSLVTAAAVAVLLGLAGGARAQETPRTAAQEAADADLEARTTAVASTLRCPVCQGESIQDSPADLAQDMRALVREQLRAGRTPEEVKAYFVGRYGEWILLEPRMSGLNILLYVFPVVLVLGGLAFVVVLVRKWSASQPNPE